jgi:hypothetical protein
MKKNLKTVYLFFFYKRFSLINYEDRFTKPHSRTLLPKGKKMILKNNESLIVFFGEKLTYVYNLV